VTQMKRLLLGLMFMLVCSPLVVSAQTVAPDELVRSTVGEVLSVIKASSDKRELNALVQKKVLPNFDFAAMTRLAVGKAWRDASPQQQKALESAFRSLLVSTYTTALDSPAVASTTVDVKPVPVRPGDNDTIVRTVVRGSGRQAVSIDYRMALTGGSWKVYDVVVENLSLVTNYRGSFASEIARSGIDGLIKSLETKNRQLAPA